MPVDTALDTARAIRDAYGQAFEDAVIAVPEEGACPADFTLSGAIVFAQYKIPLRAVIDKGRHYLDKVAKDRNGRDSLALAVMKPGGVAFDWVCRWGCRVTTMGTIARNRSAYSSGFFYNFRERYKALFDSDAANSTAAVGADVIAAVLAAEYKKQPGQSDLPREKAIKAIAPIMKIGYPDGPERGPETGHPYQFDAVLVARFLAEEGRWEAAAPPGPSTSAAPPAPPPPAGARHDRQLPSHLRGGRQPDVPRRPAVQPE